MLELEDPNIKHQYDLLNILDAKSTSLLAFNTVFLTCISVWLGYVPLNYMHLVLDIVFLILLTSCGVLLTIIWLRWSEIGDAVAALDLIRQRRTRRYRIAWILSALSICSVFVVTVIHTIGTALTTTENCGQVCSRFYNEKVFGNLDAGKSR